MYCFFVSRGHADAEIEAVFARYDLDGDRILDEDEQRRMQEDLEGQKVKISPFFRKLFSYHSCLNRI